MTEDYDCKVCGKHFAEEEDYDNHAEQDHPEVKEFYPEVFAKEGEIGDFKDDRINISYNDKSVDSLDDVDKEDADEIDQQEDKPIQSHDDWQKELEGLKDEYSTEDVTDCAICNSTEHPTSEHPVTEQEEEDGGVEKPQYEFDRSHDKKEGEEEGGADDPLSKVADLAESYRYMSKDKRAILFESVGFGQGDSAILSGLEWNELTRPVKVEASEAFAKEEDEEEETGEDPEKEENDAYEQVYNLEKNHSSPDYKKKAIECNKCNEKFYNLRDKDVHFNEVHATEQEYELPDQCPLCNQLIQEPETLDWHMEQSHGAHVPSTFTQTGISGAMADTDFDALEAFDTDWACPRCGNNSVKIKYEDGIPVGRECPKCGLGEESRASESRADDLRKEIEEQESFINIASIENPMNMGDANDKLDSLKNELASLGEGYHFNLDDTTEYPDDDYEWVDGKRVKKKKESTEEEDEGWGPNWGDPEDTAKDIYDLGHPEKTEEGDY